MKNIFRFLIGLLVTVAVLIGAIIALAILTPFIVLGGALFFVLMVIVVIIAIFAFIWYMSRDESKLKLKTTSKRYFISQGQEI